jgi:hypothetical protein
MDLREYGKKSMRNIKNYRFNRHPSDALSAGRNGQKYNVEDNAEDKQKVVQHKKFRIDYSDPNISNSEKSFHSVSSFEYDIKQDDINLSIGDEMQNNSGMTDRSFSSRSGSNSDSYRS